MLQLILITLAPLVYLKEARGQRTENKDSSELIFLLTFSFCATLFALNISLFWWQRLIYFLGTSLSLECVLYAYVT